MIKRSSSSDFYYPHGFQLVSTCIHTKTMCTSKQTIAEKEKKSAMVASVEAIMPF